ncbi:FtsW/RodA/SpoVE family cell cycle protein [uncultured Eubacterium sp.]|uniref:FtsW/RodA/SpoVE family cell cycle protein n=1 Tax=uncultured Eubacterium sp. TaxID=165185 RepID=UPI002596FAFD|nr:FtsW/RodA/SpoVE family cell cycle protein [uncultured Eubacterium sp.]
MNANAVLSKIKEFIRKPRHVLLILMFVTEVTTFLVYNMSHIAFPEINIVEGVRYYHTAFYNSTPYFLMLLVLQALMLVQFIIIEYTSKIKIISIFIILNLEVFLGFLTQAVYGPTVIKKYILVNMVTSVLIIISYKFFRNMKSIHIKFLEVSAIVLLFVSVVASILNKINGSGSWLYITDKLALNPQEIIRVVIPTLCIYLYRNVGEKKRTKHLIFLRIISALSVVAGIFANDFGSTVLTVLIVMISLWYTDKTSFTLFLITTLLMGMVTLPVLYVTNKMTIFSRIKTTGAELFGTGQLHDSLMSLVYGGVAGLGTRNESILSTKIIYANTDFAFNTLVSVYGIMFALISITPFIILVLVAIKTNIVRKKNSLFMLVASAILLTQAVIHILCGLNMLPYTGLCFPFLSQSGSNAVVSYALIGIYIAGMTPEVI